MDKFWFLKSSVRKVTEILSFKIYQASSTYAELKNLAKEFEIGTKDFHSARSFPEEGSS